MLRSPNPSAPPAVSSVLTRHGARLPPRSADIFDLIECSGQRGVLCEVLAWTLFPGQETRAAKKCVAVHVNHINDFLEPTDVMISGRRWQPYRVVARRGMMPGIRDLLYDFASTGREAYALTDSAMTRIIAALQRDPRFRNISFAEFDLLLRDARICIEDEIAHALRGRVHIDDIEI